MKGCWFSELNVATDYVVSKEGSMKIQVSKIIYPNPCFWSITASQIILLNIEYIFT